MQSFNHVFSAAAIHHLPYETQCSALKHFLRVIIEGGTISLMWNGNHLKDRSAASPTCVRHRGSQHCILIHQRVVAFAGRARRQSSGRNV